MSDLLVVQNPALLAANLLFCTSVALYLCIRSTVDCRAANPFTNKLTYGRSSSTLKGVTL